MKPKVTAEELASWRAAKKYTLRQVAQMLDVNSGSTVNAWEKGQAIPGPVQKLLAWLIRGEVPFQALAAAALMRQAIKDQAWNVQLSLALFDRLRATAMADGFSDVADYIAELVRRELTKSDEADGGGEG